MLFSCKISNSVLHFLDREGLNKEFVYLHNEWPLEFMKDPSNWVEAEKMESFLTVVDKQGHSIEDLAHRSRQLRAFGPLDSVLSMMQKPQEILAQPERFLAYFISPPPPVANIRREGHLLEFDLPISSEEFPFVTRFLQAAFEALPSYVGKPLAVAKWSGNHVQVNWEESQESFFKPEEAPENPLANPKIIDSVIASLELSQKELEKRNSELLEKNRELEGAKKELEKHFREKVMVEKLSNLSELAVTITHEINNPMAYVLSNVQRLNDYMARARQLITLLVGADRLNPAVQTAMKRVDWDYVQSDYPLLVNETIGGLYKVQDIVRDLANWAGSTRNGEQEKKPADLNQLVNNVIKMVEPSMPSHVTLDRHLLLDRQVPAFPNRLEQALSNILTNAIHSVDTTGTVRVVTRPKGAFAEIEVTDTGRGMDPDTLKKIFTPYYTTKAPGKGTGLGLAIAQTIVEMHHGRINVESSVGQGSTFTIELPI